MSNTEFKYPSCGFCRNFQWKTGNTSSGPCSEMQREVAIDGDVCGYYKAMCDEQAIKQYMEFQKMLAEVDMRPNSPYIDVCGNNYEGLSRFECMDKLVASIEAYGLWYELDVISTIGGAYEFYFAPRVAFHFTGDELRDFFARISNAINKYQKRLGIKPPEPKSILWDLSNNKNDETSRL